MEAIYIPKDLHEYKEYLRPNDVFIYSYVLSMAELEYDKPVIMTRFDFAKWVKISPSAFYQSVTKLINLGMLTKLSQNLYSANDYKGV